MSRYIDAEPLEKRSPKLRALILEQPTADVEPVRHGHWINERYGNKDCLTCSVCGMTRNYLNQFEYCPHCGARMDGKEQEHEQS